MKQVEKKEVDFNITSKSLELAAESVKGFLQSLIKPSVDEVGLFFAEKVRLWRFKNQINILQKAEEYLKERNIKTKQISLKELVPLLENSSLEEEESLQNKWATLLANTVDINSTINPLLFSHILSQINRKEAELFEVIYHYCTFPDPEKGLVKIEKAFNSEAFKYLFTDSLLEIDNLVRLRLIKQISDYTALKPYYTLTDLGFRFMNATKS